MAPKPSKHTPALPRGAQAKLLLPGATQACMERSKQAVDRLRSPRAWSDLSADEAETALFFLSQLTDASNPDRLELTESLLAAMATGLGWLAQQQDVADAGAASGMRVLSGVCECLLNASIIQRIQRIVPADAAAAGAASDRAGLWQSLGPVCQQLTSALNHRRAAHLVAGLASNIIALFSVLQFFGGSHLFYSPLLAPTLPSVTSLAMALLRADWLKGSSSSSNRCLCDRAFRAASSLCSTISEAADAAAAGPQGEPRKGPWVPPAIAASSSYKELLLAELALATNSLHHQQRGKSPAALPPAASGDATARQQKQKQKQKTQQPVVPPHHLALLDALGVDEQLRLTGPHPGWPGLPPRDWSHFLADLYCATEAFAGIAALSGHAQSSDSPGAASSSKHAAARHPQAASGKQAPSAGAAGGGAPLLVPVQLVLLELFALQPVTNDTVLMALEQLQQQTDRSNVPPEVVASQLLPAMVQLLPPTVQHAELQGQLPSEVRVKLHPRAAELVMQMTSYVVRRRAAGSMDELAAAFLQQAAPFSLLLEARIRQRLQMDNNMVAGDELTVVAQLLQHALNTACSGRQGSTPSSSSTSTSSRSTSTSTSSRVATGVAGSSRAKGGSNLLSGELVSLLITCCKTVSHYAVAGAFDSGSLVDLTQAVMAIASSSAASTRAGVWAALLGRCLVAAVLKVQELQHALAASCTSNSRGQEPVAQLLALAVACRSAVECTMQQLPQASASAGGSAAGARPGKAAAMLVIPEAVVQALLQQQAQLLQTLEQVVGAATAAVAAGEAISSQAAAGGAEAGPATDQAAAAAAAANGAHQRLVEAAADLATQLEAAGAAVAAQQPLRHCCNWHRCSSTARRSEAELVSGASSVCSRCKAARYCSRECQLAHWPDWHKAVCKRMPSGSDSG